MMLAEVAKCGCVRGARYIMLVVVCYAHAPLWCMKCARGFPRAQKAGQHTSAIHGLRLNAAIAAGVVEDRRGERCHTDG